MLSVFVARIAAPTEESVDRDPGVITLAFACARGLRSVLRHRAGSAAEGTEARA